MALVKLASSQSGRIARVLAGILLFAVGLWLIQGTLGMVVAIVSLVPIAAGLMDVCLAAPLLGAPLKGNEARSMTVKPLGRR